MQPRRHRDSHSSINSAVGGKETRSPFAETEGAIPASIRRLVESRANGRCEYCLLPAAVSFFPHEVDHIVALKHGGKTDPQNLAYACWRCNRFKGTDLGSFDPETGIFSFLFNPREQTWAEHFQLQGDRVNGFTPEGRTTVHLLQLNSDERMAERQRAAANRTEDDL